MEAVPTLESETRPRWSRNLNRAILFVGLGLGGLVIGLPQYKVKLPDVPLRASRANTELTKNCVGKSVCVIVYMAPWCAFCESNLPTVKELAAKWKDSESKGISVVVGGDETEKLEEMAAKIGQGTFIDEGGKFHDRLGITGVPYWVVLDSSANIVSRHFGSLTTLGSIRAQLEVTP